MTELLGYHSNHMEITNISLKDKLFKSPNVFFVLFLFFVFIFIFKSPNVKYDIIHRFKKYYTLST